MISEKPNWQTPEAETIINGLKEIFLQEARVIDGDFIVAPSLDQRIDPRFLEAAAQVIDLRFKEMGVNRILVVDNVCAYGQTASEVIQTLNQQTKAEVVGLAVLMSKDFQGGLRRIEEKFKIPTLGVIGIQGIGPNQKIILG